MKATTHEVVQEDRSEIMPKFLFPHLQCQTRKRNSREKALSSTEVILKEGVVPQARGLAVCNCRISINSNQESFLHLGYEEGELQNRSVK